MRFSTRFSRRATSGIAFSIATICGLAASAAPAFAQGSSYAYVVEGTRTLSAKPSPATSGVSAGKTAETDKTANHVVAGFVTDAATDAPLPSVHVFIDGERVNVRTNRDGKFYLRGLTSGKHTIKMRAIGYAPRTKEITVTAEPTTSVELWLNRLD